MKPPLPQGQTKGAINKDSNKEKELPEKISLTVDTTSSGLRTDAFLASVIPDLSRSRIQSLIEGGHVTVCGSRLKKTGKKLKPGDRITVSVPPPDPIDLVPEDIPLKVVFEDEHIIIIHKEPGMVVHPGAGNLQGTLVNALLSRCSDLSGIGGKLRPGIVHRLDKDTSGLIIAAKHDQAHQALARIFKKREIQKRYTAIVLGRLPDKKGIIDLPIARHPRQRTKMAVDQARGRMAVTEYRVLRQLGPAQLLELILHTGRTHQIRVHMSHIGHPLLGDTLYGGPKVIRTGGLKVSITRQMLHAACLRFKHPVTGKELSVETPIPPDMKHVISVLGHAFNRNHS